MSTLARGEMDASNKSLNIYNNNSVMFFYFVLQQSLEC
mgnify:CR=1 FL=1